MNRQDFGEYLAEALAVFIIIAFGDSVAAMYTVYTPNPYQGSYWGVCIAWGLSVTMAIYATGSISGTHANPAVTLALALYRRFSWRKVLPYWVAQVIGGILGAGLVYVLYVPVIDHFNQAAQLTRAAGGAAGVFFTHPGAGDHPLACVQRRSNFDRVFDLWHFRHHRAVQRDGAASELRGSHDRVADSADRRFYGLSRSVGPLILRATWARGFFVISRAGVRLRFPRRRTSGGVPICGSFAGRLRGRRGLPVPDTPVFAGPPACPQCRLAIGSSMSGMSRRAFHAQCGAALAMAALPRSSWAAEEGNQRGAAADRGHHRWRLEPACL